MLRVSNIQQGGDDEGNGGGFGNYKSKGNILDKFILDNLMEA